MADQGGGERGPSKRRLLIFYPTLAVIATVVVVIAISAGQGVSPQKSIAGGYDATGARACLGMRVDVKQSGKFVSFTNTLGKLGGALTFDNGHLTGDVTCVTGKTAPIDARATNGSIRGTVGGLPVALALKRDPPPAGTPKPFIPHSIAGEYKLAPRSDCLGGTIDLSGGKTVKVDAQGTDLGSLNYNQGVLAGTLGCKRGPGRVTVAGVAQDRQIALMVTAPAAPGAAPPPPSRS